MTFQITTNGSLPFLLQVDSAQDRVVKREDGEKLAKVGEVSEDVPEDVHRKWPPGNCLTQNTPGSTWGFFSLVVLSPFSSSVLLPLSFY